MFTEHSNTFLKFIMDLFVNTSDDIYDVLVNVSNHIVFKSDWKDVEVLSDLGDKWQKSEIPPSLTIQNMKFIKLHESPYNFVYRAIKGVKALIGTQFTVQSENIRLVSLIAQSPNIPLISTALKDLIKSIIELGQKMTSIVVLDPTSTQLNLKYPENKQIINIFIDSLKHMQFICDYKDKGDSIIFNLKYKKVESKTYSDEIYKALMQK